MFALLQRFADYQELFGSSGFSLAIRARLASAPVEVEAQPAGFNHPIRLRLKTSDIPTLQKIFRDQEYSLAPARPPRLIIDAGANIGLASIFFAQQFPHAKSSPSSPSRAISPSSNTTQSRIQTSFRCAPPFGATTARSLWWIRKRTVVISNPRRSGSRKRPGFPAVTIPEIMRRHNVDAIDLLKMDIEGAEWEIFQNAAEWIDQIGAILIELHDRLRTGCSRAFYLATPKFEVEQLRGETVLLARAGFLAK